MFYGILNATATLYKGSDKMYVVTAGYNSVEDAQAEMNRKIKALSRREYLSLFPIDSAVVNIPDMTEHEKELFTIHDGFFGTRVLWEHGQRYAAAI